MLFSLFSIQINPALGIQYNNCKELLFQEAFDFFSKIVTYVLFWIVLPIFEVQMDNVISQAQATLGALVFQRSTFGGINSKLGNVSSRLPTVWFSSSWICCACLVLWDWISSARKGALNKVSYFISVCVSVGSVRHPVMTDWHNQFENIFWFWKFYLLCMDVVWSSGVWCSSF